MTFSSWPSFVNSLVASLSSPAELFGHFTYFLLIVSMLQRRMKWLRGIAIASGITKIIYRAFMVVDPVSVVWETIFVLVNAAQLAIIWYYEHHHTFEEEERHFAERIPADIERRSIKRLLELADLERVAVGETLTVEGMPVGKLMYVADGAVKIERGGKLLAVVGPGDYVGELSFLSKEPATATATAVMPVRMLAFDQDKLRVALNGNKELQHVLDTALSRDLAGKLTRTSGDVREATRVG
jgi:CRP-like cAMP-binding protein